MSNRGGLVNPCCLHVDRVTSWYKESLKHSRGVGPWYQPNYTFCMLKKQRYYNVLAAIMIAPVTKHSHSCHVMRGNSLCVEALPLLSSPCDLGSFLLLMTTFVHAHSLHGYLLQAVQSPYLNLKHSVTNIRYGYHI